MQQLKAEWCGVAIEYNENRNNWQFRMEENGPMRHRASLAEAKKAVEELGKKKDKFQRYPVIYLGTNQWKFGTVIQVTSITSGSSLRATAESTNAQIYANDVAEHTEANLALVEQIKGLRAQKLELDKQERGLMQQIVKHQFDFEK